MHMGRTTPFVAEEFNTFLKPGQDLVGMYMSVFGLNFKLPNPLCTKPVIFSTPFVDPKSVVQNPPVLCMALNILHSSNESEKLSPVEDLKNAYQ